MKQFGNHQDSKTSPVLEFETRTETFDEKAVQAMVAMLVKLSLAAGIFVDQEVSH